mmetsp:Transcript_48602/g.105365  ORF Transcript_48602/g.105365 Transcript_48602/m.105365 type:complete len:185 (-) Transcript_48602:648-1202(-)
MTRFTKASICSGEGFGTSFSYRRSCVRTAADHLAGSTTCESSTRWHPHNRQACNTHSRSNRAQHRLLHESPCFAEILLAPLQAGGCPSTRAHSELPQLFLRQSRVVVCIESHEDVLHVALGLAQTFHQVDRALLEPLVEEVHEFIESETFVLVDIMFGKLPGHEVAQLLVRDDLELALSNQSLH